MGARNTALVLGLLFLSILGLTLLLPEVLPLQHPQMARLAIMADGKLQAPPFDPGEHGFLLGSDGLGRDRLSRLIHGARYTLGIALAIGILRSLLAIPLGVLAGWRGGLLGQVASSISAGFGAIPTLILVALILAGLKPWVTDPAVWLVIYGVVMVLAGLPRMVEHVRLRTREVMLAPHLEAAVAAGAPSGRILWRHVLPLMRGDLLTMLAAEMAWILLLMGQLAVFGVYVGGTAALDNGLGQPTRVQEYWPEWGMMMGFSRAFILSDPWIPLLPGAALALSAAAFHLLAEGLRMRGLPR